MSPTKIRIRALLEKMPLGVHLASKKAFTGFRNASALLSELYHEGVSHISGWDRPARGACTPIYTLGPGEDVPRPGRKPRVWKRKKATSTEERILTMAKTNSVSADSASAALSIIADHARTILRRLHANKDLRIVAWERKSRGPYFPLYRAGAGKDVPRPAPLPASVRCMSYRKKLKKTFDSRYAAVRELQRERIPGRQLVIDGKVVCQQ